MNSANENSLARSVQLAGAIAAFERLSHEAYSLDMHSFLALFLAQTADLLRQVQAGRILDERAWIESLEFARLVSEMWDGGGLPNA